MPSELLGMFWGGASWSLLQTETYESFPAVGRVVIRCNGEEPQILTLTMRCCPA